MDALYQKIVNRDYLNDDDYQELFQRPDAQQLAELAVMSWIDFPGYEEKLLTLPHSEVIIRYLIVSRMGTPELLDKTFDFPNAEEHILSFAFVKNQHCDFEAYFTQDVIARVFRLSNASQIIKICILNVKEFSFENEAKLFDLPDAGEVIKLYLYKYHSLYEDNHHKILDLPNGEEIAVLMTRFGYLEDDVYHQAKERGWI